MAAAQRQQIGDWIEDKTLGSGGFGMVILWRNKESGEQIAIKRCRLQSEMTMKNRQRWQLEVDIMKRLQHENVVYAKEIPPELDVGPNEIPLLGMEYCELGDLRKVINRPENCCGLKEKEVRGLTKDISAAIEYLHSKRIIHRDLKPENIVLQNVDERVVYKLIDLGYAKELDQGSVCTSFVGTLQYLAPELFASQKYTCTVDYWSFGTVVFECITGFRPFLPSVPPVQWHSQVMKKKQDQICAFYNSEGNVEYSNKLPGPNHLCRTTTVYFEQFLRLMLIWDSKMRGGGVDHATKRPKCFILLENIFDMKIIKVLDVTTNTILTYPITEAHKISDLQNVLQKETQIPIEDQELLLASGISQEASKPAVQCLAEPGEDEWIVFLFNKTSTSYTPQQRKQVLVPQTVQVMIQEPNTLLPYPDQKKAWAHAVYFCMEQAKEYRRLLQAQRAAMLSLLRNNSTFSKIKLKMVNEIAKLVAKIEFSRASLLKDLEKYEEQASTGISSKKLQQSWTKMRHDIDQFSSLKETVTQLENQSVGLQTRIVELQRSPYARSKQAENMDDVEQLAMKLYQELRQTAREQRHHNTDNSKMVQTVVKCYTQMEKLSNELYLHLGKLASCKRDMLTLQPKIESVNIDVAEAGNKLITYQKQRQLDMWQLLKLAIQRAQSSAQPSMSSSVMMRSVSQASSASSASSSPALNNFFEKQSEMSMSLMMENQDNRTKFQSMLESFVEEEPSQQSDDSLDWTFLQEEKDPIQDGETEL